MKVNSSLIRTPIILPVLIVFALIVAFILTTNSKKAKHSGTSFTPRLVEVIEIKPLPFRAHVKAYGNVEPTISLQSKTEVSGKVSFIHPDLKQGQSIAAGTVVIRIDPTDYTTLLKQTQADLKANQESLNQLEEEEKTVIRSLELAKENLLVGEREFARISDVYEQKLVSRSTLDAEKQKVISLRQQVEELQGQLNGFASRKDSVKANIARTEQQVKSQETNLGRTEISLPFDSRIGEVLVEKGEFVSTGTTLFEALDTTGVEIAAQLPASQMTVLAGHLEDAPLDAISMFDTKNLIEQLDLSARVDLVGNMLNAKWDANVLRLGESIDPVRRTISIVVGVEKPYEQVVPGRRPPLLKGMYTAVNLWAPQRTAIVIPRKAVHEGRVYIANNEGKLSIREVDVQFFQDELAVIRSGLSSGEKLIVSDVYPVIEGMSLNAEASESLSDALAKAALGEV